MPTKETLLDELAWRGLLYQQTEGLAEHLAAGPVTAYCGYDPTASSLHIGNLVPMMVLVHLVRFKHQVIALVGGGTAMIGDPSGRSTERPLLDANAIDANAAGIHAQLERVLRGAGATGVTMINNADWLRDVRLLDFLREVGKHFSVNFLLAKDTVQSRLETGISYTEFSYMLTQAYDFLQLFKTRGVTLQVGGSDQWGNITSGVELIRRSAAGAAHALTAPLITTASGKKFGKTEAGAVWLDAALTSPYQFYQFWVNTDDADVGRYLRMFTVLSQSEIKTWEELHQTQPHVRGAQHRLAAAVTTLVHGAAAAESAERGSRIVFDKTVDPHSIDDAVFEMLSAEIPSVKFAGAAELNVLDVLEQAFNLSRGAGKKLVQQGGVSVNGEKLSGDTLTVPRDRSVRGRWYLVRKGGRDIAVAELA